MVSFGDIIMCPEERKGRKIYFQWILIYILSKFYIIYMCYLVLNFKKMKLKVLEKQTRITPQASFTDENLARIMRLVWDHSAKLK